MTRLGRTIALIATLTALMVSPTHAEEPATNGGTLVIGDSLTARGQDKLAKMHPDWTVDGVRGRPVTDLPAVLESHVESSGYPSTLVIALGTNYRDGWTRDSYAAVLDSLPAETAVVFVTTFRTVKHFGTDRAKQQRQVSAWMRQLARSRPNTVHTGWRWHARRKPPLLVDGVHATPKRGERVWAKVVSKGVGRVS